MISCRGVAVSYKKHDALLPFDRDIAAGDWLGLVGPNGAGKSSLLRAIAGLVDARGLVSIGGVDLSTASDRERAQLVAYVPQDPLLPHDMSVFDYVLLGRTPYVGRFGLLGRSDRGITSEMIALLRLGDFANRYLGELSGGEQQRVVLARALAQQAPVLLLDEPTSALDIGHQQQALELITELRASRQLTVISAMHDLTLAATYTDALVMLHEGAVVADGAARDVLTAERLGDVFHVCVSVDIDEEDDTVIVVPRRGFPVSDATALS